MSIIDEQRAPIYQSPIEEELEGTVRPDEFIVQKDRIIIVGQTSNKKTGVVLIYENPRQYLSKSQDIQPAGSESEIGRLGDHSPIIAMVLVGIFGRKGRRFEASFRTKGIQ
ncbi:MAG: hypothetical protein D6732_13695 [Methanobacteriota archaeon]|nr:MAG: hypothetical protein D6732_13695 [Euryarchaeota archaeon]